MRTDDATGTHAPAFIRPRGAFANDASYNRQFDEARSPESRVDELLDAMTDRTPLGTVMVEATRAQHHAAILLEDAGRERRIVLEHGPLPPLEFTGSHLTLGEILAIIADVEADQSIEVANVLREPTTGKRIGLAFRLEYR